MMLIYIISVIAYSIAGLLKSNDYGNIDGKFFLSSLMMLLTSLVVFAYVLMELP